MIRDVSPPWHPHAPGGQVTENGAVDGVLMSIDKGKGEPHTGWRARQWLRTHQEATNGL